MMVESKLIPGQQPTIEQITEIENAADMEIIYDDDSPYYSYDSLKQLQISGSDRVNGIYMSTNIENSHLRVYEEDVNTYAAGNK